jgi:hypothetical protein
VPCIAFAAKHTKEKKISKVYNVSSDAGLDIANKYGNIYVTTWDENKTAIDIVIRVSAKDEKIVEKRLNSINVLLNATKNNVSAITQIADMQLRGNITMEINYTVKIPKKGNIKLSNEYGNIILGTIYGSSNIRCQYGSFSANELNSNNNLIKIEYCGASKIDFIKTADIKISYSDIYIGNSYVVNLIAEYSNTDIKKCNEINYNCSYGDIQIANGVKVIGRGDYLNTKIGTISNLINVTANYGNLKVNNRSITTKNIAINSSYMGIDFEFNPNYNFDFEFSTQYGGVSDTSGIQYTTKQENDNRGYYKGYYKNSGLNKVYIKTEYGQINLSKN